MNYHHLTIEERCCIREFYKNGKTFREIAVLVGRNVSTISREINRNKSFMNCKPAYYPHTAQKKYLLRRSFCHRGMFWNEEVIYYINDKLRNTWSPEQIANTSCELKLPSFKTIYRWIYEKYLVNGDVKVLRKKGKTRKRLGNGGRFMKITINDKIFYNDWICPIEFYYQYCKWKNNCKEAYEYSDFEYVTEDNGVNPILKFQYIGNNNWRIDSCIRNTKKQIYFRLNKSKVFLTNMKFN